MEQSEGFSPIARLDARVLVLGSLPGQRSLADLEYYAHPQNAFWRIMYELFDVSGDYQQRCNGLCEQKIAVWDVLKASVRPGSLDSSIDLESAVPNNFDDFLVEHSLIEAILFNGRKSEQLFRRLVPEIAGGGLLMRGMPSTSPAFAAMPFQVKLLHWREGLACLRPDEEMKQT